MRLHPNVQAPARQPAQGGTTPMKHVIATEIVSMGRVIHMTLPSIAALLRHGLTTDDYTRLALTADEHRMTIPALMRAALESGVQL
jgi:hypothetical protein